MASLTITENLLREILTHAPAQDSNGGGPRRRDKIYWATKLKKLRLRLKLSQQAFADNFGISVKALRNWEQLERLPERSSQTLITLIERDAESVSKAVACARKDEEEMA